jgi:cardiolipin synthase
MEFHLGKLKNTIICFFLLVSLLYPAIAYSVPADVTDISDNKYFDAVHNSLRNAKDSIYVSIFLIIANDRDKLSLPYLLVQDLIDAHKRGVKVVVRLDRSYDYQDAAGAEKLSQKNDDAYLNLSGAGIDCKFAIPNKTLHDKLIVVDEEVVIEGSMNWFTRALKLNRESASLIQSKEYAQEKIKRIEALEIAAQVELDRAQIETVAIRNKFLRDPNLGAKLVHNRNERGFDTYLFFLKSFQETGKPRFELDYEKLAAYLGMDLSRSDKNRWEINRMLKNLRDKYKLIDCKIIAGKPAEITLLDYDDRSKEYESPQNQYFKVPKAYWEYGWSRKLGLKSKYCYLISVYRTEFSEIRPWWSLPLSLLAEDFHLGKWTIMRGMRNLKKLGLLDVEYDAALNEEGKFSGREPNKYRIKPLRSQEEIDKSWAELKKIYTEESVNKSRELAFLIEQGNNIEIVESFIRIMERYSEEWVAKATKITAKMRPDNPSRNFGYIVGILKKWDREGVQYN